MDDADGAMSGMMDEDEMNDLMAASGANWDRMFLEMMIEHHERGLGQHWGNSRKSVQPCPALLGDPSGRIQGGSDLVVRGAEKTIGRL